jgi:AraC-like DNA-binding protein
MLSHPERKLPHIQLTFHKRPHSVLNMEEKATFWHAPDLGDLELLKATYISHTFARHTHPGFVIGMIEQGVEVFYYRGRTHFATPGDVVIINPDMVHTGHSGDRRGWTYRMFYPSIDVIRRVTESIADGPTEMPYFTEPVIPDRQLAAKMRRLHLLLERSDSRLAREQGFYDVMGELVLKHARNAPRQKRPGNSDAAVRNAIALIKDTLEENISLEELSRHVGLSPFYFTRLFQRRTGLPPHAYRKQLRIYLAKELLRGNMPIAQVAAETGFADQSHLTRHFKQVVGVTPGRYVATIQGKNVQSIRGDF